MAVFDTVLGLMILLAIAVVLLPISQRLRFPHTVLLTVVGCGLGLFFRYVEIPSDGIGVLLLPASQFNITANAVFFIFLPALIFESALSIDVRKLISDLGPILLLAVVGLLASTVIVGFTMSWYSPFPLLVCLLLGAIVSATDPVAVIAIFKELGAPKRLTILVEGESLFNDATAIVIFTILAGMIALSGNTETSLLSGVVSFIKVFLGGVLLGLVAGWLLVRLIILVGQLPLVRTTLTVCFAYLSFIIAEHHLHISGVMVLVVSALVVGSYVHTSLSSSEQHLMHEIWESISFWANSMIFIMIGLTVPELLEQLGERERGWLITLLATAFIARFGIVYFMVPIAEWLGWMQRISFRFKTVMYWGGLRGAVSLALALTVYESTNYSDDVRLFIAMMVTGFVLFTLLVNAPSMPVLMRLLGLNKLSPRDQLLRTRAMRHSLDNLVDIIKKRISYFGIQAKVGDAVIDNYKQRHAKLNISETNLADNEWMEIGLSILLARECAIYSEYRNEGMVSLEIVRILLSDMDVIEDALKTNGQEGYCRAVENQLKIGFSFRWGLYWHRTIGYNAPLASNLSIRYRSSFIQTTALNQLTDEASARLAPIIDPVHHEKIIDQLHWRHDKIAKTLQDLELQYHDYAHAIQRLFTERMATSMELRSYQLMHNEGIINQELFKNLRHDLLKRVKNLSRTAKLNLKLNPIELLSKVPFMRDFPEQAIKKISSQLKPRLALPGDKIVSRGEIGDAMYFLSNGSVEVLLPDQKVVLGSGDFFGEIALLHDEPRGATVQATSHCQLLRLKRTDFAKVLDSFPTLREKIEEVADQRSTQ